MSLSETYSTVIHGIRTSLGDVSLLKMIKLFHELVAEGEGEHRERENIGSCVENKHHVHQWRMGKTKTHMHPYTIYNTASECRDSEGWGGGGGGGGGLGDLS